MYEPQYFSWEEFDCPSHEGSGRANMDHDFVRMLDKCRELADVPFKITSGFRTAAHNKSLQERGFKASNNSAHLYGRAVDVAVTDSSARFKIIKAAISVGFSRIGVAKTFIHIDNMDESDNKPTGVAWLY